MSATAQNYAYILGSKKTDTNRNEVSRKELEERIKNASKYLKKEADDNKA